MWIVLLAAGALPLVMMVIRYLKRPPKTSLEVPLWLLDAGQIFALLTSAVLFYRYTKTSPPMACTDGLCWEGPLLWTALGIGFVGFATSIYRGHLKKQQAAPRPNDVMHRGSK